MHAEAEVCRNPERQVRIRISGRVEPVGILEHGGVAVGGGVDHRHLVAGADGLPSQFGIDHCRAAEVVERVRPTEDLLHGSGDPARVGSERCELVGVVKQGQGPRREHRAGGVVACSDELNEKASEVDIGHQVAVELLAEQHIGEIPLGT